MKKSARLLLLALTAALVSMALPVKATILQPNHPIIPTDGGGDGGGGGSCVTSCAIKCDSGYWSSIGCNSNETAICSCGITPPQPTCVPCQ